MDSDTAFTSKGRRIIERAFGAAIEAHRSQLGASDLLLATLGESKRLWQKLLPEGADIAALRARLAGTQSSNAKPRTLEFAADFKAALDRAFAEARVRHVERIGPKLLLLGVLETLQPNDTALEREGVDVGAVRARLRKRLI